MTAARFPRYLLMVACLFAGSSLDLTDVPWTPGAALRLLYAGVTVGSEASLVVLDASPLDDIRNTQRIAYVIHNGEIVDRQAILQSEVAGLRR